MSHNHLPSLHTLQFSYNSCQECKRDNPPRFFSILISEKLFPLLYALFTPEAKCRFLVDSAMSERFTSLDGFASILCF
jgi:hypothetical protein